MLVLGMVQKIATISLLVENYQDAITFYCDRLGFDLVEDTDLGAGRRWVVVAPRSGGGARILLARAEGEAQRQALGNQAGGRVMLFLETDDFAGDHAKMVECGVAFLEPPRHEAYGSVAVFADLYGNKWDLIEPRG